MNIFFHLKLRFPFSSSLKSPSKESLSWLRLLRDSEYIRENLYSVASDPNSIRRIFQSFIAESQTPKNRPSLRDFEDFYFRNMVKLVACYIQLHKNELEGLKLDLIVETLKSFAQVYDRFGGCLKSSKTILFTGKLWKTLYLRRKELDLDQAFQVLETMVLLDYKNRTFIEEILEIIRKEVLSMELAESLKVIKGMSQLNARKEDVLEVLIDRIYPKLGELKANEIAMLALNLSKARFKVNKHFLLKMIAQFNAVYEKQKLDNGMILIAFGAFSGLESMIGHKLFYLDELDTFYVGFINKIIRFAGNLQMKDLGYFANGLQKLAIYEERALSLILQKTSSYFNEHPFDQSLEQQRKPISQKKKEELLEELENVDHSSKEYQETLIELKRLQIHEINKRKQTNILGFEHYVRIIHCFAFFYYKQSTPFLKKFLERLVLVLSNPNIPIADYIDLRLVSRFLYSIAILLPPEDISTIASTLLNFLGKHLDRYRLDAVDRSSLKLICLYLKQNGIKDIG